MQFAYEIAQGRGLGALYVAFSGGKDSIVIAKLAELSGIPFELHYNITGIDPPEVIYFMRKNYPQLNWHRYKKSMWQLIVEKKMPPTRIVRYCCSELKEHGGKGRVCVTGVRWAESVTRRKNRRVYEVMARTVKEKMLFNDNAEDRKQFEICQMKSKLVINPIIDWADKHVWEFIHAYNLPYCELYDTGTKRIGCIGCPMSTLSEKEKDFEVYPKFKDMYIQAFDKMLATYTKEPKTKTWKNGQDVFDWWLYGKKDDEAPLLDLIREEYEI